MTSTIQLGDYVCFREGHVPEALKGREREFGTIIALVSHKDEQWPVVQFDGYRTPALSPGLLEVVGEAWPTRNHSAENADSKASGVRLRKAAKDPGSPE